MCKADVDSGNYFNFVDAHGLRQGWWLIAWDSIKDKELDRMESLRALPPERKELPEDFYSVRIRSEGLYHDNMMQGFWYSYDETGKLKDSMYYVDGTDISGGLNYVDAKGKRQGYWTITGAMDKNPAFSPNSVVEAGFYIKGLKEGWWKSFNPDGTVKDSIFCVHVVPEK
jgi:hypothetical protein